MFNVDTTKLNAQERKILDQLTDYAKVNPAPTITGAANICGCAVSQISKVVRKAGFQGYKRFIYYLYFSEQPKQASLDELERLKRVLLDFDIAMVSEFAALIADHERIVLFGYGPSSICAQYFEYKLRICSSAFVSTAPDEQSAKSMLAPRALLVILTTTGQYRSFESLTLEAKEKRSDVVVVSEEFNPLLMANCNRYFVLTNHKQSDALEPYEKTRTVFFIFLEQVIQKILSDKAQKST